MPKKAKKTIKLKIKRKKKMEYKCVGKIETLQHIHFQEKNEHGAMNNITKTVPYYNISFQFFVDHNRPLDPKEDAPMVLDAAFHIQTRSEEIYKKYQVGGVYKELPTSV